MINLNLSREKILASNAEMFAKNRFAPFSYFPKQQAGIELLTDKETRFFLYGGGAGGGKSWLGWEWFLWSSLAYPGIRSFVGRQELKRLRQTTLKTFFKVCKKYQVPEELYTINNKDNIIVFSNGSQIDMLDLRFLPSDPLYERFGSYEYTQGWLEEAGEINFGAFDVLKSRIGRQYNDKYDITPKLYITCNPKRNWLYRTFYTPSLDGTLPDGYMFLQSLAKDNPKIESSYIANLDDLKDPTLRKRLRDGLWEYDDNPYRLITDDAIKDVFSNTGANQDGRFITGDVARYGSDLFVIMVWYGFRVVEMSVIEKSSLEYAANIIEELRERHKVGQSKVLVDEDGVGGGLVDFRGYTGFVNNSSPLEIFGDKENYQNLSTQCAYRMAKRINDSEVWIDCEIREHYKDMLIQDMEFVQMLPKDENQKLRIVPKEKVKEDNGGRSPDFWDCIKMREWFEIAYKDLSDLSMWGSSTGV